jgi:hypothetical protein
MSIDKLSDFSDNTVIEMKRLDTNGKTIDTERNKIYHTKKQSNLNNSVSTTSLDMNVIRDKATCLSIPSIIVSSDLTFVSALSSLDKNVVKFSTIFIFSCVHIFDNFSFYQSSRVSFFR